ncbi:zinc finger protein 287-like isoform X4 [Micropterus dolomieu]|uniref:zinc finger protein 287-like isoform X4 n=1 Tax=Micropterus dolomieu TaxID=147949 RepID=UPI001E8CF308|nr:zinc finger protein 287-like isoform X4 [Micropterus dolomieu]
MSKVQTLRAFVQQRLSAAAEEIFELFERTIAEYEEELCGQRKLLDAVFKPEVRLHRADVQLLLVSKEEVPPEQQEWRPSLDQEDPPEPPHIKEGWSPSLDQEDLPEPPHIKEGWSPSLDQEDLPEPPHIKEEWSPSLDQEDPPEPPHIKEEWSPSLDQEDPPEPPHIKEESSPSLDQEDPQSPTHIKEEQEELCTRQEGEQLQGLEEADIIKFTFTPVLVKSEEDDEEKPQSSQLHQRLTEQMKTKADGEDCGEPEPDRNVDPDRHLQPATDDKTSHSSEPETDDSCDWKEIKEPQSGSNPLQNNSGCNTGEKSFSCSECGKRFRYNSKLKRHMRIHTGDKPFSCSVCSKRFNQRVNLTHHMALHTGEKRYICSVCGRRFTWSYQLKNHLCVGRQSSELYQRLPEQKKTEADGGDCGGPEPARNQDDVECNTRKTSSSASEYSTSFGHEGHLQKHNGIQTEELFSCSVCGKGYYKKNSLRSHMRLHSEEKCFSCSVCKKTFRWRGDVVKHMRTHTGEKPFSCSVCGKGYPRKNSLLTHMRLHSEGKRFSCSVCKKTFQDPIRKSCCVSCESHATLSKESQPLNKMKIILIMGYLGDGPQSASTYQAD